MRLLPCGDRALLAEFASLESARAAHARWSAEAPGGIVELVPAARTVLVRLDPAVLGLGAAEHWLAAHEPDAVAMATVGGLVTLPVVYNGDDLDVVAEAWGCSPAAVVERHAATEWVCAFIGFAPGFPYLVPAGAALPPVPRRATSRPSVPAGAVALAAEYCGIYPRCSPGGWQLIGRTDAVLWDADRVDPALVAPGARVRFTAVRS
ncbi:5-oxoprolinase subunit B family protein [Microcella humidisoli]|uniref:Allophanate hydrolase subunit 1 n=1 Tax=Microcella humidisoli TaxID=2963406 RepID=A0ABY5FT56_9MICO|nr:allophanate hydrolase subunit 1 [Microcella humidisoli]UTT61470.1 allophanate hydrolase subunit 1 [Microcella humidisoli]